MYFDGDNVHIEEDDQCFSCEYFMKGVMCPLLEALAQLGERHAAAGAQELPSGPVSLANGLVVAVTSVQAALTPAPGSVGSPDAALSPSIGLPVIGAGVVDAVLVRALGIIFSVVFAVRFLFGAFLGGVGGVLGAS